MLTGAELLLVRFFAILAILCIIGFGLLIFLFFVLLIDVIKKRK